MIHVEFETTIHRPIENVFNQLVDIDAYPDWLPKSRVFLSCNRTSDGPEQAGTTFIDKTRVGTYRGIITDFQKPVKVDFRMRLHRFGVRMMESRPGYRLQSVDGGTTLFHTAEGELFGIFKLLEPYIALRAREERIRTVRTLKTSLEK